jgi:hemolysin III
LHLFCTMLLPFGLWHLVLEANGNPVGMAVATLYVLSNILCYGTSALYHVGRWSFQVEIFLQKLDHCAIAILSVGTFLPTNILLLEPTYGMPFLLFTITSCLWACYNIIHLRPSVTRQMLVAGSVLPFMPLLYYRMNRIEYTCALMTIVCKLIGVTIFQTQKPDPFPKVLGYHEVFHFFVVCAGVCVYLANWSIIRRVCNPYAHHTEITELMYKYYLHFLESASSD